MEREGLLGSFERIDKVRSGRSEDRREIGEEGEEVDGRRVL